MMDFFHIYQETTTPGKVLEVLNSLNYAFNIFFVMFLTSVAAGMFGHSKCQLVRGFLTESKALFYGTLAGVSAALTLLNYQYGIYLNFDGFLAVYVAIVIGLHWNINRKSLKWFTTALSLFFPVVLLLYTGFLHIISTMNGLGLEGFEIQDYQISYKDFFQIYHANEDLLRITYHISTATSIDNNDVYKRVYIFYYFMNNIAILFWLFVYHNVLSFHGIRYKPR